jgi:hypothetical protein
MPDALQPCVIAAYAKIRLIPKALRALPLELFTKLCNKCWKDKEILMAICGVLFSLLLFFNFIGFERQIRTISFCESFYVISGLVPI